MVHRCHLCHSPLVVSTPQNQVAVSENTAIHCWLGTRDPRIVSCPWCSSSSAHHSAGFCTGRQTRTFSAHWSLTAAEMRHFLTSYSVYLYFLWVGCLIIIWREAFFWLILTKYIRHISQFISQMNNSLPCDPESLIFSDEPRLSFKKNPNYYI